MAEFMCSCGEKLVAPQKGMLRCWFCSAEYSFPEGVVVVDLQYEEQQSRPIIRTLDVHTMGFVKKESDGFDI